MNFPSWLRPQRGRPSRRPITFRPRLTMLEDRTVPAVVTWYGDAGDFNWHNPLNWRTDTLNDTLPGASDDVVIDLGENDFTVKITDHVSIQSLTSEASLTITGGISVSKGAFVNRGSARWEGGNIALHNAGTFVNAGTLDIRVQNGGWVFSPHPTPVGTFINTGAITRTQGSGDIWVGTRFDNNGSLGLGVGGWDADGGGTSAGSFDVAADATLAMHGQTLTGTSSINGAGAVELDNCRINGNYDVSGETKCSWVTFSGAVTNVGPDLTVGGGVDFGANPISVANLSITNGYFKSSAALDVSRSLTAREGSVWVTATATVAAGATLTIDGLAVNEGTLVNRGAATWLSGNISVYNAGAFVNAGTLDIRVQNGGWVFSPHPTPVGTFINTGAITRTQGSGDIWVGTRFDNNGSLGLGVGGWDADGGGTSAGSFDVAADATLAMHGQTLTGTSSISGAGDVRLAQSWIAGGYHVTGSTTCEWVTFACADGPVTSSFNHLTVMSGSRLTASNDLIVAGDFTWVGTVLSGLSGQGSLTVQSDMTLNGSYSVLDFDLINAGYARWTSGRVDFDANSSFTNRAGATFDDKNQAEAHFGGDHPDCPIFYNEGKFIKSGGDGTTYLGMQLVNSGTVQIESGILDIHCGYIASGGGSIEGDFEGDYSIGNGGEFTCRPTGNPTLVTNFTQTAAGTLVAQIGGLTAGTDYGQIIVTGDVNLDGTLQVMLIRGFAPDLGDEFTIIKNDGLKPVKGTFAGLKEGATVWAGPYGFTISYIGGGDGRYDVTLTLSEIAASGPVQPGQTATIGFWQNKNGQALIKALNGGASSTKLGNWLAATLPNLYGAGAGANDLTGKTNAEVAAAYQRKFTTKGQKLEAQVMATALAVYVTSESLAGTTAAAYGFLVTQHGVGFATFNVGSSGAAVDRPDGTVMRVLDILRATDALAAGGNMYGGDAGRRKAATALYTAINEAGDI